MSYFSKTLTALVFACSASILSASAFAVQPINFDGPKITYDRKLMGLGDFATYNFMSSTKLDASVPSAIHSTLVGLDNLNQWPQLGPNVFYALNSLFDSTFILKPIQVLEGNFNGNATSDLVVLNPSSVTICKEYNGSACPGGFSPLQHFTDGKNWHAAVGKLKDGKDTIAVITQDGSGTAGKLVVYATNATGDVQSPYYNQPLLAGAPFSLAIGDYDADGKQDIAVAARLYNPGGTSSTAIYIYKNNGVSFDAPVEQANLKDYQCYTPTGLVSYNPDGDGKADLVLTCFDRLVHGDCAAAVAMIACPVSYESGYVYIMKNNGGSFAQEHVITNGLKFPYSSAVGRLNDDAFVDVAVANWRRKAISVYAGINIFKTEDAGKHYASQFNPKYIQIADKNDDGALDIISVATPRLDLDRPGASKKYLMSNINTNSLVWMRDSDLPSYYSDDVGGPVYRREGADRLVMDAGLGRAYESTEYHPLILSDSLSDSESNARPAKGGDVVKASEAVLVLVNYHPQVSFDPVDCSSTKVVAHCTPSAGHTISPDGCVFSSADIPEAVANVQKVVNGSGVDLSFNLPQEERDYTATVTATDEAAASSSQTIVVKRQGCTPPLTSVTCPAQKARFEVWVDDPFQLCIPMPSSAAPAGGVSASSSTAYSVDFTQTAGPNMFVAGAANPAMSVQATASGNCLSGRFSFPENDIDVKGTYKLKNNLTGEVAAECPWEGKVKAALLSGSGVSGGKCSLGFGNIAAGEGASMLALFGSVLSGMFLVRKKQK